MPRPKPPTCDDAGTYGGTLDLITKRSSAPMGDEVSNKDHDLLVTRADAMPVVV